MTAISNFSKDVEREEVQQKPCKSNQDTRSDVLEEVCAQAKDINARMGVLKEKFKRREAKLRAEKQAFLDFEEKNSVAKQETEASDQVGLMKRIEALVSENKSLVAEREDLKAKVKEFDRMRVEDQRAHAMSIQLAESNCQIYKEASAEMHAKVQGLNTHITALHNTNLALQREIKDEKSHHRIAVNQVTNLNRQLDSRNQESDEVFEGKRVLEEKYRYVLRKVDYLERTHEAAKTHMTASYESLKKATAECDQLRADNARQTVEIKNISLERESLRVELQRRTIESKALKMQVSALQKRNYENVDALSESERKHDATVSKLEIALAQKQEALQGQLEALKMVQNCRKELDGQDHCVRDDEAETEDDEGDVFYNCVESFSQTTVHEGE